MNNVSIALLVAFAGAVAASLLMAQHRDRQEAEALKEKDIQRWADDGGKIPRDSAGS